MKVLTWNIQWGLGCDGTVDLPRIVETAEAFCDADVICFQEVSRGFRDFDLGQDQPALLANLLPGYTAIFRPAVDLISPDGGRQVFGNMILSRLPVLQVTSHMLPWPPTEARTMQRQALEAIVKSEGGAVAVTTCHLEFHSTEHREAQVREIQRLHVDRTMRGRLSFEDQTSGPYRTIPPVIASIVCGDFNFEPDDSLYDQMQQSLPGNTPAFIDAWTARHPRRPHAPTAGITDVDQWPNGAHCRDFIFVTDNLRSAIRNIWVDTETTASDHQPVAIDLDISALESARN